MSRNLYTLAVVAPACDLRLRSVIAASPDTPIVEAEATLRESAESHHQLVAFYRCLLDGWNRTHATLRNAAEELRPALLFHFDELDEGGCTWFPYDGLEALPDLAAHHVLAAGLGGDAATAFWQGLQAAGSFAAAHKFRTIVLHRVLGPSF